MLGDNIKTLRTKNGLSQEELAIKLNVVRQTISKWEKNISVPDSSMLIMLAEELDTTVSTLLDESVAEPTTNELKAISEKLEVINLQLAKRSAGKLKAIRFIFTAICAIILATFFILLCINGAYLNWDYSDPELAVVGTMLHGFEFLFVRISPILFIASLMGIIFTYKKR